MERHLNNYVFDLMLADAAGQLETLGVSGYHPFYDLVAGWTQAESLYVGERLRGDYSDLTVVGIVPDPGVERVYNMTVEGDHVYFVGNVHALVHNICNDLENMANHVFNNVAKNMTPLANAFGGDTIAATAAVDAAGEAALVGAADGLQVVNVVVNGVPVFVRMMVISGRAFLSTFWL